jgi:hypothetical protein
VKRRFTSLSLSISMMLLSAGCKRVSWPVSREFCGQVRVIDKHGAKTVANTELLLYRSDSDAPCCSKAQRIAEISSDYKGNFNSGSIAAGKYFLVVKNSPDVVFPLELETSYDGKKCSLNTDFSFNRNTGRAQQTVILLVDRDAIPKRTD